MKQWWGPKGPHLVGLASRAYARACPSGGLSSGVHAACLKASAYSEEEPEVTGYRVQRRARHAEARPQTRQIHAASAPDTAGPVRWWDGKEEAGFLAGGWSFLAWVGRPRS